MKILLINKFLYPKGGDAISALNTGHLLLSKGHKVVFWGMNHPSNPEYPWRNCFVSHIDFNDMNGFRVQMRAALNMLYSREAKIKIEKVIKTEHPDIVHLNNFAHQISPSILHVIRRYNIPTVMTMHDYKLVCPIYTMFLNGKPCERCKGGSFYQCFINKCTKGSYSKSFLNAVEMYLHHRILHIYDLIDIFIAPSLFIKDKVKKMIFNGKIVHLNCPVNIHDLQPHYQWEDRTILYFGRLSKEKGLFILINAFKDLKNIKLKIIGDGPSKEDLETFVKASGLRNIEFLGYKTTEELKQEIKTAMFFVLPSLWYENNPLSIIEGFALGKPAIGSKIGGIPELIKDNENGLLFEPSNSDDLRLKIEYLANNPDRVIDMGKKARKFIEERFDPEKHYKELLAIYEEAIRIRKDGKGIKT